MNKEETWEDKMQEAVRNASNKLMAIGALLDVSAEGVDYLERRHFDYAELIGLGALITEISNDLAEVGLERPEREAAA